MQTMTSAYANKMLKSLEEDKAFWLNKEEEALLEKMDRWEYLEEIARQIE